MTNEELIRQRLAQANDAYYNSGTPIMPDAEFDALVDQARILGLDVDATVGAPAPDASIKHPIPMLSLAKFTETDKALEFLQDLRGEKFMVQPKLDGVSLSLEYEKGSLKRAVTRGDGVTGEDVTHIVKHLPSVPTSLSEPLTAIVRGEVVIHRDELDPKFKNTRNSVAGLLNYRTKSPEDAARYNCRFYAFDYYGDGIASSVIASLSLANLGFAQPVESLLDKPEDAIAWIRTMLDGRDQLPYDIDGVVVKVSSFETRTKLGNRSNSPRWAFAFKEAGQTAVTKLLNVTWQTGSNGAITPVAELAAVDLGGTTIRRASLHNPKFIYDKDIRVDDNVTITRAGDVIPYVVSSDGAANPGRLRASVPTECPTCGGEVVQEGNSQQIRCVRTTTCPAQVKGRLTKWVGRDAADIDAIGAVWIEKFVDAKLVESPADFYRIRDRNLRQFDGMGDKNVTKFLNSIDKSKNLGMRRALIGFCIPFASEGTAKRLCKHYDSVEAVAAASTSELSSIDDIGPVVAKSIHAFFASVDGSILIQSLRSHMVNLDRLAEDAPVGDGAPLSGKTYVITGKLSVGRAEFAKELEAAGAKVSGSVSKNTTALITDDPTSNSGKAKKARELGAQVLSEAEIRAQMNG